MKEPESMLRRGLLMMGLCAPLYADVLSAGMPAPGFALRDAAGKSHRLENYAGRWLVLYFYPKNDTPGCTAEACAFRDELTLIHELDARVVGISVDDAASHQKFSDKYDLPFTLLSDPEGRVAERYGARGSLLGYTYAKRYTFLIDPAGTIRHIWHDVQPKQHARNVIAVLRDLQ